MIQNPERDYWSAWVLDRLDGWKGSNFLSHSLQSKIKVLSDLLLGKVSFLAQRGSPCPHVVFPLSTAFFL